LAPTGSSAPSQEEIRAAAGKAYLGVVNRSNKSGDALYKAYKNKTSHRDHSENTGEDMVQRPVHLPVQRAL
jgi:hypothetical protein